MNGVLKIFLSMSCSGGLLILALLFGKRFLKDKVSCQWQYYIWLVVVLRLLLPFGTEVNLLGKTYEAVARAVARTVPLPLLQPGLNTSGDVLASHADWKQDKENVDLPAEDLTDLSPVRPLQEIGALLINHVWLVWLATALGLLIRKITIYQGFIRYIHAGLTPVSDMELLDRLSVTAKGAGIKRPIELCVNPLISSPLLIGFFRPCIVLPRADIPEEDFPYIVLHELTHWKRGDLFYKWLVQVTVCLHWFNPLVHLMSREVTKACEFSCDEAVLAKTGYRNARDYGKTLLDAMAAVGRYKENLGAVTLSENKQLLKERLGAIMNFKKKSMSIRILTGVLTVGVIAGAAVVGVYPAAAAAHPSGKLPVSGDSSSMPAGADTHKGDYAAQAERYYEADSLPLFEITFPRLDKSAQKAWLERFYKDGDLAFFSAALRGLGADSSLIADFAEKAYAEGEIAFFSIMADCMDETELELWLDRALEEGKWNFQSMLFDRLNKSDEFDKQAAQEAEYQAAGIVMEGRDYYYQGQLVNIFLDIRANKSFYTLNMNPAGTVNIKVTRDGDNKITGIAYMTEAEVTELLEGMGDDDDDWQETAGGRIWHPQVIPVNLETVADGEVVWLGEYTLFEGDRIWYNVLAETGNGFQLGFAKPGDAFLNTTYYSVKNLRQQDKELECNASFTVGPPVQPGTYKLFLKATDGALGNVKGGISMGFTPRYFA